MPAEVASILLSLGLPGVVILCLGWYCLQLDKRLNILHETRATEAKALHAKTSEVVERNTAALDQHTDVIHALQAVVGRLESPQEKALPPVPPPRRK